MPSPTRAHPRLCLILTLSGATAAFACGAARSAEPSADASGAEAARRAHAQAFFEKEATLRTPIFRGWARLHLDRDLPQGNADIRAAYAGILATIGKGATALTPRIAGDEGVKWQMRNWIRIYFTFSDRCRLMPGRLEPETQRLIEELFWNYVCDRSHFDRAQPRLATDVHGSENHELMHYSNALMALQALKDLPDYRERKLPDGRSAMEHFTAWNAYYKHHCLVRAMYGDQIELFSDYWKYSMPELLNMCDLAEDPALRSRMRMLLDVLWTDWAVGQLNAARGGCKTRTYQQKEPDGGELTRGSGEAWCRMSGILFDRDNWWSCSPWWHGDPIRGDARVLASTQYRLPDLVKAIADDPPGRGEYMFVARRISQQRAMAAKDVPATGSGGPWYAFDTNDSRMLSCEFCTPDFVMGALIVDPTLKLVTSHEYASGKDLAAGYPSLTAQNRYCAIQFATGRDARVVPQCLGLGNGKTYNQQQAVLHKNILVVQRNKNAKGTGAMRIYFARGMKDRIVRKADWFLLQEGAAFLAVRVAPRTDGGASPACAWDNEFWLRPADPDAPVLLVGGRTKEFQSLESFASYAGTIALRHGSGKLVVSGKDIDGAPVTLALYTDLSRVPEIGGRPVDFAPRRLYDSPFLLSDYGSGIVTLRMGGREIVHDFSSGGPHP